MVSLSSCGKKDAPRQVVLYTSCDDYLLRDIIPAFEKESGIKVLIVGDTEATKTTGLVQRVIDEKDHPRADVWWSNEPFGTARLDGEGLLAPYTSAAEREFASGWPTWLRARDRTWYGFALRSRVIAVRVSLRERPQSWWELADPRWKKRIGMARPQFGTTRGHMGALIEAWGPEQFRTWLIALKANGVRLYDGNSGVVRGVAQGEIDVGLTDSDDVLSAKRNLWPVEPISPPLGGGARRQFVPAIPNTVGLVKGGPHPEYAGALADFLLSGRVEEMLNWSESQTWPVHPAAARTAVQTYQHQPIPGQEEAGDLESTVGRISEALQIWDEVFGR